MYKGVYPDFVHFSYLHIGVVDDGDQKIKTFVLKLTERESG